MKIFTRCISIVCLLVSVASYAADGEQPSLSPKDALQRLMEGNERFALDKSICPERNQERRLSLVAQQRPFAIILGCSDSRIPPEMAFDQRLGDVFVVRIAGNVVDKLELDSVEYSVLYNKSSIIMVLGHENCGAVSAVVDNNTKDIEGIAKLIRPALHNMKKDGKMNLDEAIEANVRNSVERIRKSPALAKYIQEGKVDIVGAVYSLNTGKVRLLEN